jgi:hypothetical protein
VANGGFSLANIFLQSNALSVANTLRADVRGNTVPATAPTGELVNFQLALIESSTSTFQLVDNAPASANATAELTSHNTGSAGATAGVSLIAGPISTPPLLAAPGGVESVTGATGDHDLTSPELAGIVEAAIHRWASAGLTDAQLDTLDGLEFGVADLGGPYLGLNLTSLILIDDNAAGYGWFVDATPFDDAEFGHAMSATQLQTDPSGSPAGQMDLLTLVMHEIGHVLGLGDTYALGDRDELMFGDLVTGERRLPDAADAAAAFQPTETIRAPEIIGHAVGGFDAEYYLAQNPDVAAAGIDPLAHYNTHGWHEGRDPNAFFDTAGYLAHYADVAAAGINPLEHYEQWGWKEGRDPSTAFDTLAYLAANPDVAAAHVSPLDHFLQSGFHEGRMAINDGLWR